MVHLYRDTLDFHTVWAGGNFAEFETASALFCRCGCRICATVKVECKLQKENL